jgi:beta-glucosidase
MNNKQQFLSELIASMTLEEKIGQMNLVAGDMDATGMKRSTDLEEKFRKGHCGAILNVYTPAATRALQEIALQHTNRIPLIFGYDVIHGHRTIFPIPLALACSWNLELIELTARTAATEAAADGLHWVYSPMVDISWDPRWGRVAEGAGEDPWLGSKIAAAMVRGYQGENLSHPGSVAACVKHFALYGAAMGGRDYHTVDMSRRTMEETYLPPYRAAIDAGARTVMTAFNEIEGIPASGNRWLLTDLLRDLWNFKGVIVTDYTAVSEMKNHGTAADDAEAAVQSFHAGVDMDMVSEAFLMELPEMVRSGRVLETDIDRAVMHILEMKWDLGLFESAFDRIAIAPELNRELARQAARESMVLLKNESRTLPLSRTGTIAIIGPLADSKRDMLGCWKAAGDEKSAISPFEGIEETAGPGVTLLHARGSNILTTDDALLAEALETASRADTIVLILGESADMSGEAASRADIRIPKCQRKLAIAILKTGKPCVLVTVSGRPLELSQEDASFPAILHIWAPGMEGGRALGEILFGDFAPVGKLPMGFPHHVGQLPMSYREKPTGRPFQENVSYTSKYLDVANHPLYPFGHGLTYAEFEYGELTLSTLEMRAGETLTVSAELKNCSARTATETLQLYIRDRVASVTRPLKELRGFHRVTLAPGAMERVTFEITEGDLSFPGADFKPVTEPGEFDLMVGPSSANLRAARFRFCPK